MSIFSFGVTRERLEGDLKKAIEDQLVHFPAEFLSEFPVLGIVVVGSFAKAKKNPGDFDYYLIMNEIAELDYDTVIEDVRGFQSRFYKKITDIIDLLPLGIDQIDKVKTDKLLTDEEFKMQSEYEKWRRKKELPFYIIQPFTPETLQSLKLFRRRD